MIGWLFFQSWCTSFCSKLKARNFFYYNYVFGRNFRVQFYIQFTTFPDRFSNRFVKNQVDERIAIVIEYKYEGEYITWWQIAIFFEYKAGIENKIEY